MSGLVRSSFSIHDSDGIVTAGSSPGGATLDLTGRHSALGASLKAGLRPHERLVRSSFSMRGSDGAVTAGSSPGGAALDRASRRGASRRLTAWTPLRGALTSLRSASRDPRAHLLTGRSR